MIYVITSAAVNYLPKVRILFNSIKVHHPEFSTCLVLVDREPSSFNRRDYAVDRVIRIDDLKIRSQNSWIFQHSIVELCTGVKAFALNYLLDMDDCEAVLYFDPDMAVFSRLDDMLCCFEESSILLTPHQTKPEESIEAIIDNEICSLQHGIYNLGFIGVKNDKRGREFVNWWQKRLEHFCFADLSQGLFVDQRWIDFAPVFFEGVKILKTSRYNVATWNITTRKVKGSADGKLLVDNEPLGFYHFTGFDSGACQYMANKYAKDNPAVMGLIKWYEDSLIEDKEAEHLPWGYGRFENGQPITDIHRRIYRMRKDLQDIFQDPFKTGDPSKSFSFYSWFEKYARKEHPDLFNSSGKAKKRFGYYVVRALTSNKDRKTIIQKAWTILKKDGFPGLKRALSS